MSDDSSPANEYARQTHARQHGISQEAADLGLDFEPERFKVWGEIEAQGGEQYQNIDEPVELGVYDSYAEAFGFLTSLSVDAEGGDHTHGIRCPHGSVYHLATGWIPPATPSEARQLADAIAAYERHTHEVEETDLDAVWDLLERAEKVLRGVDVDRAALVDAVEAVQDMAEQAHNECDTESDTKCEAEQYGDGNVAEHAALRRLQDVIDDANVGRVGGWRYVVVDVNGAETGLAYDNEADARARADEMLGARVIQKYGPPPTREQLDAVIARFVELTDQITDNWERGDLAGAVNELREFRETLQ